MKKFIAEYRNVTLRSEGHSRKVSIPQVALAQRWLANAKGGQRIGFEGNEVVLIPAGSFTMGCTSEQKNSCETTEQPSHKVTISGSFYMMRSEVTQGLYKKVMGKNPSRFSSCGSNCPVEKVSWYDAVRFANKLSEKEGLELCYHISGETVTWSKGVACTGWRLPTEAEWEYAARGGQSTKYAGSNEVGTVAWYADPFGGTHAVCGKKKNGYGLCDMSGNVWEWVWDWKGSYSSSSQADPLGPSSGSYRVYRGGSWNDNARFTRVSNRSDYTPSYRSNYLGFRLSRSASAQ